MSPLLSAPREILRQAGDLLLAIDDVTYATRVPAAFNASIGGHVRHCLDHFDSLLHGAETGEIDYDARARDQLVETVRAVALSAARRQLRAFERWDDGFLRRPVTVRALISYAGEDSPTVDSLVGREVMFAVGHAIHHFALIGVMAGLLDVPVPAGFGVAPSTLRHEREELAA